MSTRLPRWFHFLFHFLFLYRNKTARTLCTSWRSWCLDLLFRCRQNGLRGHGCCAGSLTAILESLQGDLKLLATATHADLYPRADGPTDGRLDPLQAPSKGAHIIHTCNDIACEQLVRRAVISRKRSSAPLDQPHNNRLWLGRSCRLQHNANARCACPLRHHATVRGQGGHYRWRGPLQWCHDGGGVCDWHVGLSSNSLLSFDGVTVDFQCQSCV